MSAHATPRALVELHERSWSAMCKLLCANCYVQTGMCKMTFLLVTSLIMVRFWSFFFVWKLLSFSWSCTSVCGVHECLCNSTSSRAFKQKKIDQNRTIIKEVISKLVPTTNLLITSLIMVRFWSIFFVWKLLISSFHSTSARATSRALVELHESSWSALAIFWLFGSPPPPRATSANNFDYDK